MKLSVIIPVYNKEKYLRQCLDSVLDQGLKELEVIAVDDGSTDSSGAILDEYARRDPRIKAVHQKNQGAGPARNTGLELAAGDYIFFLDADDFLSENRLLPAYEYAVSHDADMTYFSFNEYNEKTGEIKPITTDTYLRPPEFNRAFSWRDFPDDFFLHFGGNAASIFFRSTFLMTSGIRFRAAENSEDFDFIMSNLLLANSIIWAGGNFYNYRKGTGTSIEDRREDAPLGPIYATDAFHDFAAAQPFYPEIKKGAARINALIHVGFLINCKKSRSFIDYYNTLQNGTLKRQELTGLPRGYLYSNFADSAIRRIVRSGPIMPANAKRSIQFWKGITFFGGFIRWFFYRLFHNGPAELLRRLSIKKNNPHGCSDKDVALS